MKKFILSICAVVLMAMSACSEKDEGPLGNTEDKNDEQYKEVVQQANDNVASVGSLVNALNNDDIITSVTPIKEGDKEVGYTFTFDNSRSISVYYENKNSVPALGVKPDNTGDFYWTLNGEWLLDDTGKKILYDGTSSSILPKLKVENNNWMLSVDNGKTWKKISPVSSSSQGNNKLFKDINVSDAESVTFTFVDGTKLVIPREPELTISFSEEKQILVKPNSTVTIDYTITGKIEGLKVEVVTSGNVKAEIKDNESAKGTITITAGESIDENDKVILIAKNKSVSTSKTLSFEEQEFVKVTSETAYEIAAEGGTIKFNIETNTDYSISIPEEAKSWISVAESRAIRQETVTLSISENEGDSRSVTILLVDKNMNKLASIQINQAEGIISIPIDIPSDMTIAFPDINFRKYVLSRFDKNHDGIISEREAFNVIEVIIIGTNLKDTEKIKSLEGIQYFPNLDSLYITSNSLTRLDVSKNTALKKLVCSSNELWSLDVSKNTALTELKCGGNELATLDVSKNTALTLLNCNSNKLTTLDVSKNTALTGLECDNNRLTSLDVSKNTALKTLLCIYNQLTTLDVSKNTALTLLWCYHNQLTSLNVSNNAKLRSLECYNNQLTSLDVTGCSALTRLRCDDNQLTTLDVSKNTALANLYCNNNQLTSLDVTGCTELTDLTCYNNQLTILDVSKNKVLNYLKCNMSSLLVLYVSNAIYGITNYRSTVYINSITEISYI